MTITSLSDLFNFLIQNKLIGLAVVIAFIIVIKWAFNHPWISEQVGKFLDVSRKKKEGDIQNNNKISSTFLETSDKLLNGMFETNQYFKDTVLQEVHKLAVEQDMTRRLIQGANEKIFSYGEILNEIRSHYRWLYLNDNQTKLILVMTLEWMQYKICEIVLENKNKLTNSENMETYVENISIKIQSVFGETFSILNHFMSDSGKLDRLLIDFIEYEKISQIFPEHAKKISSWKDEEIRLSIKNLFIKYSEKLFKHYM